MQHLLRSFPLFSPAALPSLKPAARKAVEPCEEAGCDLKEVVSERSPGDFSRLWIELVKGCWQGARPCPHGILISSLPWPQIV